jgi:SAM-dependent methyltransferase
MKIKKTRECPICQNKRFNFLAKVNVYICNTCGFGLRGDIPEQQELNNLYKKDYFDDKNGIEYEKDAKRKFRYLRKYFFREAKILDFGCGMGQFTRLCKEGRFKIYGYDVSGFAASRLRKKHRIPALSTPVNRTLYPKEFFDFIVLFDVIEHIKDFEKTIGHFYYWLKKGGMLILTTPNIKSWDARLFRESWDSYQKRPEHIYFFSPKSISSVINKVGFNDVKVKNWGFVRSIRFIADKKIWGESKPVVFIRQLLNSSKLGEVFIYFKMHNMLITARK